MCSSNLPKCESLSPSDSATTWAVAHQVPLSMGFTQQEYWSGLPSLLQIFQTQELNPSLLHCRCILYHLNHQGHLIPTNKRQNRNSNSGVLPGESLFSLHALSGSGWEGLRGPWDRSDGRRARAALWREERPSSWGPWVPGCHSYLVCFHPKHSNGKQGSLAEHVRFFPRFQAWACGPGGPCPVIWA